MAELTLISAYQYSLKPLVEAALANQLKLLKAGVRRTEQRIMNFEEKYRVLTQEFINRFENDEFEETLEFAEWIGEYRLLKIITGKDRNFARGSFCQLRPTFNSFLRQ